MKIFHQVICVTLSSRSTRSTLKTSRPIRWSQISNTESPSHRTTSSSVRNMFAYTKQSCVTREIIIVQLLDQMSCTLYSICYLGTVWCNNKPAIMGLQRQVFIRISKVYSKYTHTAVYTQPFSGPLSRTTQVSRHQKGETNLDFTEPRDSEWQWHQLGHKQVCTLLQTDNHASTPPLVFLQAGCPSCRPTNSVKALKAFYSKYTELLKANLLPVRKLGILLILWIFWNTASSITKQFTFLVLLNYRHY